MLPNFKRIIGFPSANTILIILTMFSFITLSCKNKQDTLDEESMTNVANSFSEYYFNFRLTEAKRFCTPESAKWLIYMASNISQEDIEILKNQERGASSETISVELQSDTTGTAVCRVENFLKIDTLGRTGMMTDEASYRLNMVKRNGQWLVRMEGLPQNEKQNRD